MTDPEPYFLLTSEAQKEIKHLALNDVVHVRDALEVIKMTGSLPDEMPEIVEGQEYTIGVAGEVTLVYRELTEEEIAQQNQDADGKGYILLDLFQTDAQQASSLRRDSTD